MSRSKRVVFLAVVLILLVSLVVPVVVSAGEALGPKRIWVHFNPKYFAEGNNLPVYDDAGVRVGWLQAKTNPDNPSLVEVRWSWDGKLWTPPFRLGRDLRWSAYNEAFRVDFIGFFSHIGLIFYCVDFRLESAPEPNGKLPD